MMLPRIFSRIFKKISTYRLALVGMADGRVASTMRLKFLLKLFFLTITKMFLMELMILGKLIDIYVKYCTKQEL